MGRNLKVFEHIRRFLSSFAHFLWGICARKRAACDRERRRGKQERNHARSLPGVDCFPERCGDLFLLASGDAVEKGKGERAPGEGFCKGKCGGAGVGVAVPSRLQMDRGKVAAGGDAAPREGSMDPVAVNLFRQQDYVNEPTNGAVGER